MKKADWGAEARVRGGTRHGASGEKGLPGRKHPI